jgi:hypothetical protein
MKNYFNKYNKYILPLVFVIAFSYPSSPTYGPNIGFNEYIPFPGNHNKKLSHLEREALPSRRFEVEDFFREELEE